MADKSPLSIPSIASSSRTPSPNDNAQSNLNDINVPDESSESENETEPARVFQRRVSTSKNLNGSVSENLYHIILPIPISAHFHAYNKNVSFCLLEIQIHSFFVLELRNRKKLILNIGLN